MLESAECRQCNDVSDKGIHSGSVQQQLNDHFIALRAFETVLAKMKKGLSNLD